MANKNNKQVNQFAKQQEIDVNEVKFVDKQNISENLQCIICQCLFNDPVRMKCAHTYCRSCLMNLLRTSDKCPECRTQIDLRYLKRDLTAYNLIQSENVFCMNDYCNWQGQLFDLENHLQGCEIYKNGGIPKHLQEFEDKQQQEKTSEQEQLGDKFEDKLKQNDGGSLFQRLYQKKKDDIHKMFNQQQKELQQKDKQNGKIEDEYEDFMKYLDDDEQIDFNFQKNYGIQDNQIQKQSDNLQNLEEYKNEESEEQSKSSTVTGRGRGRGRGKKRQARVQVINNTVQIENQQQKRVRGTR
ncbi:hypothetical protein PPERSA_00018 [Pseudocohnilembus persalinus]|uniref:RING-type domain-containing protein n=1 Tax=Pseudocohnilembus persalinus TaxID=266149 RepID=A0A0V0QVP9_PSEPJ|nr:hypothetical protein PPERSA_00018 [Pseudocohnilembus persalinus]|eukprot:KRX06138.1 hypothetical protein PPERSA_00018 [Pseudocohnilembus persalinus]